MRCSPDEAPPYYLEIASSRYKHSGWYGEEHTCTGGRRQGERSLQRNVIQKLSLFLKQALDDISVMAERDPKKFKPKERNRTDTMDALIDDTERRRQRPKQSKKQALHYSGKKKAHTDKNVIIATVKKKRITYLSKTYPGKTHDKKVADNGKISYPTHIGLHIDTGLQGYEPKVRTTCQPKKKPRKQALTDKEKEHNRKLSKFRVKVEHAISGIKRSRTVKDILRNIKDGFSDLVMGIACGLHNFRVERRKKPLKR